tara:strand:+ start:1378 stop:1746 length:369 start_codon:yes stop_codon:yes gene_type:complete
MMTQEKTFEERYDDLVLCLYAVISEPDKKIEKKLQKKAKKAIIRLEEKNHEEQTGFYIDELFEFALEDAEELMAIIDSRPDILDEMEEATEREFEEVAKKLLVEHEKLLKNHPDLSQKKKLH